MTAGPGIGLRAALAWALVGIMVGAFAQWTQLRDLDWDLTATLRVGSDSAARDVIVEELGPIPVTRGAGHDGQYFYLIARDPWAVNGYADLADDGAYRFRRPLYGWLAGGFGLFPPQAALIGLVVWSISVSGWLLLPRPTLRHCWVPAGGVCWACSATSGCGCRCSWSRPTLWPWRWRCWP